MVAVLVLSKHAQVADTLAGLTTAKFLRQNIEPALEVVTDHVTALKRSKIFHQCKFFNTFIKIYIYM